MIRKPFFFIILSLILVNLIFIPLYQLILIFSISLISYLLIIKSLKKILIITIICLIIFLFNVMIPDGKIIYSLWGFNITDAAALEGVKKALIVYSLFVLSTFFSSVIKYEFLNDLSKESLMSHSLFYFFYMIDYFTGIKNIRVLILRL